MQDHTVRQITGERESAGIPGVGAFQGHDSGGLIFVSTVACLDLWKKYTGNPSSGELESRMGFYYICFVTSFLLCSPQIFSYSLQNYPKGH